MKNSFVVHAIIAPRSPPPSGGSMWTVKTKAGFPKGPALSSSCCGISANSTARRTGVDQYSYYALAYQHRSHHGWRGRPRKSTAGVTPRREQHTFERMQCRRAQSMALGPRLLLAQCRHVSLRTKKSMVRPLLDVPASPGTVKLVPTISLEIKKKR